MKPMKMKILVCAILMAVSCFGAVLGNGYVLVLPENPSKTEKLIAEELRTYIRASTGAEIKVDAPKQGKSIFIGKENLPSDESWRIEFKNGDVRLLGGSDRGICYAAYEFMERILDIRWLGVGHTYIPKPMERKMPDHAEWNGTPAFPLYRVYYMFHTDANLRSREIQEFLAHNKANNYMEPRYGYGRRFGSPRAGHTFLNYSKDFPVEISWMNSQGKRIQVKGTAQGQICYTNKEVRARFKQKLRQFIENDRREYQKRGWPAPVVYDISMNDCDALCHCPECKEEALRYGVSGLVARFVNDIAESIQREYPEVIIQFFAYKDTEEPPTEVKLAENVMVRLATLDLEFNGRNHRDVMRPLDAPQNEKYRQVIQKWSGIAPRMGLWDYWKMYYEPFANPIGGIRNRAGYVRFYRDNGIKNIYIEAEVDFRKPVSFAEMRAYVGLKLLDNPDRDVDSLIDDYLKHAYRKAASPVKEYLELLEQASMKDTKPLARSPLASRTYLTADFFRRANELLDKAEQLAADDARVLEGLKMERLVLDLALANLPAVATSMSSCMPPDKLDARILENIQAYAFHFWKKTDKMTADFREDFLLRRNRPSLPDQFKDKSVVDLLWPDITTGDLVVDADAAGGKGRQIRTKNFAGTLEQFHAFDFEFGIYSWLTKSNVLKKVIPKNALPKDEKYHFHYLGRARLGEMQRLWIHRTWFLSVPLNSVYDSLNPSMKFDVYVSVKFMGPSYVPGSPSENALRVDRIIFVRLDGDGE